MYTGQEYTTTGTTTNYQYDYSYQLPTTTKTTTTTTQYTTTTPVTTSYTTSQYTVPEFTQSYTTVSGVSPVPGVVSSVGVPMPVPEVVTTTTVPGVVSTVGVPGLVSGPMKPQPVFRLLRQGSGISPHEQQGIVNTSMLVYQYGITPISNNTASRIKKTLGGDWIVIVYPEGKPVDFNMTCVQGNDYMYFTLDNMAYQVCRLR